MSESQIDSVGINYSQLNVTCELRHSIKEIRYKFKDGSSRHLRYEDVFSVVLIDKDTGDEREYEVSLVVYNVIAGLQFDNDDLRKER